MRDHEKAKGGVRHPPGATDVKGGGSAHHAAGGERVIRKAASGWLHQGHGFDAVAGLAEMVARRVRLNAPA
jgi:hypothetical protein